MALSLAHRSIRWALCALACAVGPASADLRFTQEIKVFGPAGTGKAEVVRQVRISGEKERSDAAIKEIDALGEPSGLQELRELEIVRLDRDLVWRIDPKNRTYVETPLADSAATAGSGPRGAASPEVLFFEAPDAGVVLDTKRPGVSRKIGGWNAERAILTARTAAIDRRTGERLRAKVTCDLWLARDLPGEAEMRVFDAVYAARTGSRAELARIREVAGSFPVATGKLLMAWKTLDGYPIKCTWAFATARPAAAKAEIMEDELARVEGATHVQYEPPQVAERETDPNTKQNRPELDLIEKKPRHPEDHKAGTDIQEEPGGVEELILEPGMMSIARVVSILTSVEAAPAAAPEDTFEPPAGYVKAEKQM